MGRRLCKLQHAKELSVFHQATDLPGGIFPGDLPGVSDESCAFALRNPNAVFVIPCAVGSAHDAHAVSAVIQPRQTLGDAFHRQLFGKVRGDHHTVIGSVAAAPQEFVHDLLRQRKSEGRLCALRFKGINDLNLVAFIRNKETHLLRHGRVVA